MAIPIIIAGILWEIKAMTLGLMSLSLIAYYLNSYWSGRLIGYSSLEQIKDILPSFLLAATMSAIVFVEGLLVPLQPLPVLIIQLMTGALLIFGICEGVQFKDYIYIRNIVFDKFLKRNRS